MSNGYKESVMFYNHGGGYVIGSGRSDGANLARNFDVVVVETNHWLGLLGFLYLDRIMQVQAIWVCWISLH